MRGILFRGKRIDNGEWIEGFPMFYKANQTGIAQIHYTTSITSIKNDDGYFNIKNLYCPKIIPKTLGQYTGLTDKTGKKIFDGDIVVRRGVTAWEKYVDSRGKKWSRTTSREKDEFGTVIYDATVTQFTTKNPAVRLGHYDDIEVIGNIHDNPELLEG